MTKALDAAIRAAKEQYEDGEYPATIARAVLHAALPAEPTLELIWEMMEASRSGNIGDVYDALRAHLLGEAA